MTCAINSNVKESQTVDRTWLPEGLMENADGSISINLNYTTDEDYVYGFGYGMLISGPSLSKKRAINAAQANCIVNFLEIPDKEIYERYTGEKLENGVAEKVLRITINIKDSEKKEFKTIEFDTYHIDLVAYKISPNGGVYALVKSKRSWLEKDMQNQKEEASD